MDVSIIILNYNSGDYTINCINSIFKFTAERIEYEIIIVDNNSSEAEWEKLKQLNELPKIKLFRTDINLGFAGGNSFGQKYAEGKYLFFLNNDCEFINDNISILYDFMETHKDTGLCSGQMYSADKKMMKSINYLPTLSLKLFGNSALRFFHPENYPDYKIEYHNPLKVPCLAGASMFFNRDIFNSIGGFDLNYFLYCEEEDIAKSLKNNNSSIYLVPSAKYIHHLSKSTELNYKSEREFYISLMYYFKKHNNYFIYSFLKFYYFIKLLRKFYKNNKFINLAFFVLKGASQKYSLRHEQKNRVENLNDKH